MGDRLGILTLGVIDQLLKSLRAKPHMIIKHITIKISAVKNELTNEVSLTPTMSTTRMQEKDLSKNFHEILCMNATFITCD